MPTFHARALEQPWYRTGLVEAAGRFTFSRTGRAGDGRMNLYFQLSLGRQGIPVVRAVREAWGGIGSLYGAAWRVTRLDELPRIVDHLDLYPLAGPQGARYALWREMVRLKSERFRRPPRATLEALAGELQALAPRARHHPGRETP